jgi:hypothetical protein
MTTEVIYARVPTALKEAADAYANQSGKTLTGAVVDLLDRGLSAVSNERSISELETNLTRVTTEKARVEADLHTAQAQLATLGTFADRAAQRVGDCPGCKKPITGHDLLAVGQCPSCRTPLSNLIVPESGASSLDQRELLILVGALGAVLAVAYLSSKK